MLYDEDTETCIDDSTCPCEFPGHVHSFTEGEVHTEGCMNWLVNFDNTKNWH